MITGSEAMRPMLRRPALATFLVSLAVTSISLLAVSIAFRVVGTPVLPVVYFLTIFMPIVLTPVFIYPLLTLNQRQDALAAELRRQAETDALTGLPNRRAFFAFARAQIDARGASGTLAALMVDVDNFKRINDAEGHDRGDVVLKGVADVIRDEVVAAKAPTAIAARIGGEEFAIVVAGLAPSAVARLAERVCGGMHRVRDAGAAVEVVTVSVGVAFRKPGMQVDHLLKAADDAVYAAKRAGRDRWAFAGDGAAVADADVQRLTA